MCLSMLPAFPELIESLLVTTLVENGGDTIKFLDTGHRLELGWP